MASNGNGKGGLVSAGGILSIVAGAFQINCGVLIADFFIGSRYRGAISIGNVLVWFLPFLPDAWRQYIFGGHVPSFNTVSIPSWAIIGGCAGVLGIIALAGGISAIIRKRFGLSLAGAICALPSGLWGILAVIFVALGKREFGAES